MAEDFKAINSVIELFNAVITAITNSSLSNSTDLTHLATPTYITILMVETISDDVIEALTKAKKSESLSVAEIYFHNSSAYLKNLERVLCEFSIWLSANQKSSLSTLPANVREFLNYLIHLNLPPAKESKNKDFDIHLLNYTNSRPSDQYTDKILYCFEQLKVELQANRLVLERANDSLTSIEHIKNISIRGRMAIAIECISKEVKRLRLQRTEIDKFIEFFWSFVEQDDLAAWDIRLRSYDELCDIWNNENDDQLSKKVADIPDHIREMCRYTIELGEGELYGAVLSYSPYTYQCLLDVFRILTYTGRELVNLSKFQRSLIAENYGWGFYHHRSWFEVSEQ